MGAFPFTFRQLEVFLAVCDERSFARAAEILNISEAGVSNQIRSLEERLSCTLFERRRGKVNELSQSGLRFRSGIIDIMKDLQNLSSSLDKDESKCFEVRMFIGSHLFEDCIRPNIHKFYAEDNGISLVFKYFSKHADAIRQFDAGSVDTVVISTRDNFSHKNEIEIGQVKLSVFANDDIAERAKKYGIENVPFVMPAAGTQYDKEISEGLKSIGVETIRVAGRYHHHDVAVRMATAGSGAVATVSTVVSSHDTERKLVSIADIALFKRTLLINPSLPQEVRSRVVSFVMDCTRICEQ